MDIVYYSPEQPRKTRYLGIDEKQLATARIKRQTQFRKAGVMLLIGLVIIAVVLLML